MTDKITNTREQAIVRATALRDSLNDRLKKDHKKHIQILTGIKKGEDGQAHTTFKFVSLDSPEFWEYAEALVQDYCESLTEVKRTKTTLVVMS